MVVYLTAHGLTNDLFCGMQTRFYFRLAVNLNSFSIHFPTDYYPTFTKNILSKNNALNTFLDNKKEPLAWEATHFFCVYFTIQTTLLLSNYSIRFIHSLINTYLICGFIISNKCSSVKNYLEYLFVFVNA